jgi:hypothetical protein
MDEIQLKESLFMLFFMLLILLRWTREDEEGEKNEPTKTTIEQSSITIRVKETI